MTSSTARPHRFLVFRQLRARQHLFLSGLVGLLVTMLQPPWLVQQGATRLVIGWNAGACLYLALTAHMMFTSDHARMRDRARQQDEGRVVILILVILTALATLGAIIAELALVKAIHGLPRYVHMGLTGLTIASSWAFTHSMFALHYAHDYYMAATREKSGGLSFPGTEQPDYGDFLYFACVIGTSAQTADVSFTSAQMRRTGLVHCVLAFFFNTTLVALAINLASSLL